MQIAEKCMMLHVAVNDMAAVKRFYVDMLGLKVTKDFRQDDSHWWVELSLPQGGVSITLTTFHMHMKPGTLTLYFATSDIAVAHKSLSDNGVQVGDIMDDLHGPGSGTKWFSFKDTEGNLIHMEQA